MRGEERKGGYYKVIMRVRAVLNAQMRGVRALCVLTAAVPAFVAFPVTLSDAAGTSVVLLCWSLRGTAK